MKSVCNLCSNCLCKLSLQSTVVMDTCLVYFIDEFSIGFGYLSFRIKRSKRSKKSAVVGVLSDSGDNTDYNIWGGMSK